MLRFIVLGAFSSEGKRLIEGVPPGAHYFLTNLKSTCSDRAVVEL